MPFVTPSDGDVVASGFAAWIANSIGPFEYDGLPGVVYDAATEWPIYIGPDIPPTPARCAIVSPVGVDRLRGFATYIARLQVRLRGLAGDDPAADVFQVRAAAQAIEDLCMPNGFPAGHVAMGTINVGTILLGARGPIPADERRRPGYALNVGIRYRKPLPLDGPPPFVPMPPPVVDQTALDLHLADETPHFPYDDTTDLVAQVEEEY